MNFIESQINGKLYRIPEQECKKLNEYIQNWERQIIQMNSGKRPAANLYSVSFTMMLIDFYERNFKRYIMES